MPEHVHLLLSEPKHGRLENRMRRLNRVLLAQLVFEFKVFTHSKFVETLRHIHRNPSDVDWWRARRPPDGR